VVGLDVRLEHRRNRDPLGVREPDVVVHEADVGIDDGELLLRLAAEQVGGASGLVVEELAEEHAWP
jgi:hypothetical protein